MWAEKGWKDYEVLDTSDGEKLERWGKYLLVRPDPQIIWKGMKKHPAWKRADAVYSRSKSGGGSWSQSNLPAEWRIGFPIEENKELQFIIKPTGFKHTGLFPEQAVNWDMMIGLIKSAKRPINVLNLFAYTGGATMACASAGASVCHVDAATSMVQRAKENMKSSSMEDRPVRYIIDDCVKFVKREINRGRKYDAIIMDPPSFGRGPTGELWKIESNLDDLIALTKGVLSDDPLFYLINSYTTGLQPGVIANLIDLNFKENKHETDAYEVGLPTQEGIPLPCGCSGLAIFKN